MSTLLTSEKLAQGVGLSEAVVLNMNAMVGIRDSAGDGGEDRPQCLQTSAAGAALSRLDGLVRAELVVATPRALKTFRLLFALDEFLAFQHGQTAQRG
jgi:hypothetical protein